MWQAFVVVTLAVAVGVMAIPTWLLVNVAMIAGVLAIVRWRWGTAVLPRPHFAILRLVSWLTFALFLFWDEAGLVHPFQFYIEVWQALARMAFLMLVGTEIWESLWTLRRADVRLGV